MDEKEQKKKVMQRKMKRPILGVTPYGRISNHSITTRTGVTDAVLFILHLECDWRGNMGKTSGERWAADKENCRMEAYT